MASIHPAIALALHVALAVVLVAAILAVAWLVRTRGTQSYIGRGAGVYESGAPAQSAMTGPVPASYFQIAAFFVIFDFEAAVLYTWAVSAQEAGWTGLGAAALFIGILLVALAYLWADGALDIGPETRRGPLS